MSRVSMFLLLVSALWLATWPCLASEPSVQFSPCRQRNQLREQHPDTYRTQYVDWRLPTQIRYRNRSYSKFLSERASATRWVLPDKGSIEHVYGTSCHYDRRLRYPGQPTGYARSSYAQVLLPGMSYWGPPRRVLQVDGHVYGTGSRVVSGTIDVSRLRWPADLVDRYALYGLRVRLLSQRAGSRAWSTIASHLYYLSESHRISPTIYAALPAGAQRVRMIVTVSSLSSKPISLGIHAVRLKGVHDASSIRTQLQQLSWRGQQQPQARRAG